MGAVVLFMTVLVKGLEFEPLTRQTEVRDSGVILGRGGGEAVGDNTL
jgi:hypothetical protein